MPGRTLMQKAGMSAYAYILQNFRHYDPMVVLCGSGNNGGDGYVVAACAIKADIEVLVLRSSVPDTRDAEFMCSEYERHGGVVRKFAGQIPAGTVLIVDAMLGTGINRPPTGSMAAMIQAANSFDCPVIALDIPSGLESDTGTALDPCIKAATTVTFIGRKVGCFTGDGRDHCGKLYYDSLDVPPEVFTRVAVSAKTIEPSRLAPRRHNSHKGDYGRLTIAGGDNGMLGAVLLAGRAALLSGCGIVQILSTKEHFDWPSIHCPELMSAQLGQDNAEKKLWNQCDVLVIGPGLGCGPWGFTCFREAIELSCPLVVDADGLNVLAELPNMLSDESPVKRENWILTPHPGEAAGLLGCTTANIQQNRIRAAQNIVQRYGGVCVLKGAGTVVADSQGAIWICDKGNPGMATAGMGDVLSGVIGALLAGGLEPTRAATLGIWIHSASADYVNKKSGPLSLTATHVINTLPIILRKLADLTY